MQKILLVIDGPLKSLIMAWLMVIYTNTNADDTPAS